MIAFEFLNKDTCAKNKIYDELEKVFMTSHRGYVSKRKFNLICKKPTIIWWNCPHCNEAYWICYSCEAVLKRREV